MMTTNSASLHVAQLVRRQMRFDGLYGSESEVDVDVLTILRRLSIRHLFLAPRGVREPHWHTNAHELAYCLRGEALVTIASNHSQRDSFIVEEGDLFFVPSGAMHSIENTRDEPAEFLMAYSHEKPEDFGIKAAFGSMTDAVLGNTYDLPSAAFLTFDRTTPEQDIIPVGGFPLVEGQARHLNQYKYALEETPPQVDFVAGTVQIAKAANWPVLRDLAVFSVCISGQGMREPHWHPETAEMGFVIAGAARMTVLDPDGGAETYVLSPGDTYFVPPAYPHHIENIGQTKLHILVFYDKAMPGDVGFRSLINVYPRDIIASALGIPEDELPNFPFTESDPLLVSKVNPTDPIN